MGVDEAATTDSGWTRGQRMGLVIVGRMVVGVRAVIKVVAHVHAKASRRAARFARMIDA
jgi:hypothetical protein